MSAPADRPAAAPPMGSPWQRKDTWTATGLAALVLLLAVPFRARVAYSWDAALLALGVREFDFAGGQPHAPGYPLYVFLGKVANVALHDPASSLVAVSLVAYAAVAALTYALARTWNGRAASLAIAIATCASPILVLNGLVGLSYVPEAAAGLLVAIAAWRAAAQPTPRRLGAAGLAFAFAVGLRPSSAALLAGLALWLAWRLRGDGAVRRLAWVAAPGAAGILAWLVPGAIAGGGWSAWMAANAFQSRNYILTDPVWTHGWAAVRGHAQVLGGHLAHAAPVLAVVAALTATLWILAAATRQRLALPRHTAGFLLAWLVPGALFFLLVYDGWPIRPDGYLAPLVPPAALLLGTLARHAARAARTGLASPAGRAAVTLAVAALAVAPLAWAAQWPAAHHKVEAVDSWWRSWDGAAEAYPNATLVTFYAYPYVKLDHPEWTVHAAIPYFRDGQTLVLNLVTHDGHDTVRLYEAMEGGVVGTTAVEPGSTMLVEIAGHPLQPGGTILRPGLEPETVVRMPNGATAKAVPVDGNWTQVQSYEPWNDPTAVEPPKPGTPEAPATPDPGAPPATPVAATRT